MRFEPVASVVSTAVLYQPKGGGGGGGLKAKILEEKYEAKLEFPSGWWGRQNNNNNNKHPWGEYGHFLELHNNCP